MTTNTTQQAKHESLADIVQRATDSRLRLFKSIVREDNVVNTDLQKAIAERDAALAECERLRADLRDTFAGIALGAMIGSTDKDDNSRGKRGVPKFTAYAYEYADAMLAARGKP